MRSVFSAPLLAILLSLGLAALIPKADATVHVVAPDGTGDYPTIQAALDVSIVGDVIELTDGIFTGEGNRDLDYDGKAVTVRSQSQDPTLCVIACDGSMAQPHRGFSFVAGEGPSSVLQGITIRDGWVTGSVPSQCGGAIYGSSSSPTLMNLRLIGNACGDDNASGLGGAIYWHGGSPVLSSITATQNAAGGVNADGRGGAIYLTESVVTLQAVTLSGNHAAGFYSTGYGGALWAGGSTIDLVGGTVSGNQAGDTDYSGGFGGGVYLADCEVSISGMSVASNRAQDCGGGLYMTTSVVQITEACLASNQTGWPFSEGDGIYVAVDAV